MSLGLVRPASAVALLAALGAVGCTDLEGREPPPEAEFYFPTGLAISPGKTTLYVANSDFDLRYQSGWVQAVNLKALRDKIAVIPQTIAQTSAGDPDQASEACTAAGLTDNPDRWLNPGPCAPIVASDYIEAKAFIGAFASGALLTNDPNGNGARLFVPVRGDPSITYFDVHDDSDGSDGGFALNCKQNDSGFCGDENRVGRNADDTMRGIDLPADPVGIAANASGTAIVVAHQTQQAASLLSNPWASAPQLEYFAANLPPGPTEAIPIPLPGFVAQLRPGGLAEGERVLCEAPPGGEPTADCLDYKDGFMVTFRSAPQVDTLRYFSDAGGGRPFLIRAASTPVAAARSTFDSRGIAIVDDERKACEQTCVDPINIVSCMRACAEEIPLRVYMANRGPSSLLIGRSHLIVNELEVEGEMVPTSAFEETFFHDSVPLTFGPSRMETGQVVQPDGTLATRVFAVCFDSRSVFIFDPEQERIELVIRTGRGPHDIAIDTGVDDQGEPYSMLYVGHFTDSYIGAVDLDMRHALTYGQMIATIGVPVPPVDTQ